MSNQDLIAKEMTRIPADVEGDVGEAARSRKSPEALFPPEVDRDSRDGFIAAGTTTRRGDELCAPASMRRTMSPKFFCVITEVKKTHGLH